MCTRLALVSWGIWTGYMDTNSLIISVPTMCIITICLIFYFVCASLIFLCVRVRQAASACMDELYLTGLNPPPQDDSFPLSLATDRGD